jgi:hypothetical protein
MKTSEDLFTNKEYAAIADVMRGCLGDNPCVLTGSIKERYYFSDYDLVAAFWDAEAKLKDIRKQEET